MESRTPGPSKGYQKQIKQESIPKTKAKRTTDYSSPMAMKWPLFLDALESGNVDVVRQLIEEGLNVNLLRGGVSPLMIAASRGQTEIAEAILQAGVNINAKSDDGSTALHRAAFDQAETGVVWLLMESGIDVEAKNKAGKTALHLAEEKKHREIVRIIKQHQAKLRTDAQEWDDFLNSAEGKPFKQSRRYDSLMPVFRLWWLPIVILGGAGLLVGILFDIVILAGVIGIMTGLAVGLSLFLWERKLRAYLDDIGPLPEIDIQTIRRKRAAGEPIFVRNQVDGTSDEAQSQELTVNNIPDLTLDDAPAEKKDETSKTAGSKKHGMPKIAYIAVPVFILLVIIGAGLYKKDALVRWYFAEKLEQSGIQHSDQAFLAEVEGNNEEAVDLFIKAGENLNAKNEKGQTALIIASELGYARIVAKLAKLNPSLLNQSDNSGNTALMTAASQGREDIVTLLRESGLDVNFTVPSRGGAATALQAALDTSDFKDEHMRIVQYLLQNGANAKGRNAVGRFPLLFAVDHGRTEAAKLILDHGADVNDADQNGNFALLSAACNGYPWLVTMLAEKGAHMQAALPDGYTPLMCASRNGHMDVVKALLEKGANVNAKTTSGLTALDAAAGTGNVDLVKMLIAQGAQAGSGTLPDSFMTLKGKIIAFNAHNIKLSDMLQRITRTASQDGYTINVGANMDQKATMKMKAPWNKVLSELAAKNRLFLLVRGKEIYEFHYGK